MAEEAPAKTCFLINVIATGDTYIDDYVSDPEMLAECLQLMKGKPTMETLFHIFAGPYTMKDALKRLQDIKRMESK